MTRLTLLLILLLFSGCGIFMWTPDPTPQEIRAADYGNPPRAELIEPTVREYLRSIGYRDPMSAIIDNCTEPKKTWERYGRIEPPVYGWEVECSINAKNAFGAYTGFETGAYFFRDGQIIRKFSSKW